MIQVREARSDDLIDVIRMGRDFAELADEPFDRDSAADHFEWILANADAVAFIAIDIEGRPVGICAAIHFPTLWDSSKRLATELWWYVDPKARGNGVGTALKDTIESWAKAAGAYRVLMMTLDGIGDGVDQMYLKDGYRPHERSYVKEL